MAKPAPRCMICEKNHWGRCPEWVDRIRKEPLVKGPPEAELDEVLGKVGPAIEIDSDELAAAVEQSRDEARTVTGFAPEGQCAWCDARRAANAEAQRKARERRKGK